MPWMRLAAPFGSITGVVVRRVRESSSFLPLVRRKPRVVLHWLLGARAAQITLVALILFAFSVFPRVREPMVNALVPNEGFGDRVTGVFGVKSRADTIRERGLLVVDTVAWVGGVGIFMILLLIHLPAAVARSNSQAREREREADALRDSAPLQSVLLYHSAILLTCDRDLEGTLEQKIRDLDSNLADARRADPNATVTAAAMSNDSDATGTNNDSRRNLVAGRYAVAAEIGRGANGIAYRGDDVVLERPVALKRLSAHPLSDNTAAARFEREARILAQLNHPNIVQVYDLAEHEGSLWMVMELVDGGDMASYLDAEGALPTATAADLAGQVARALGAAHERGVIHRDLKPANILMANHSTPKVTDFGLAKLVGGSVHTVEGTIMGSPYYMSPEQADGRAVDPRCDIYALGVILYYMIAGRVPFEGDFTSVLAQHIRKPAKSLRKACPDVGVPPCLDRLVLSMLSKQPDDRPDTMAAVADALTRHARPVQPTR